MRMYRKCENELVSLLLLVFDMLPKMKIPLGLQSSEEATPPESTQDPHLQMIGELPSTSPIGAHASFSALFVVLLQP